MTPGPDDYARAVGGWAEHLRGGGTTPWSRWTPAPDDHVPALLPDGPHLEVLRRLNLARAASGRSGPLGDGLADRVLTTGAPGRGPVDVPLPWTSPAPFGTPARDPEQLPVAQLLRLITGALAHLLPGVPPAPPEPAAPHPMPWHRRFQLHGAPLAADVVRRSLREQGLAESSWRATHVVLALPLPEMMAEQWAVRVRRGGTTGLPGLWRRSVRRGSLPAALDVVGTARRLAAQGRAVHVVLAPDAAGAAAAVARLLDVRPAATGAGSAARTDLVRRVNELTPLVAGPERVRGLATRLDALLAELDPADRPPLPAPRVPRDSAPWARQVAASYVEELLGAGYPVHGDPGVLAPEGHGQRPSLDPAATLELGLRACLRAAELQGGPQ